MSQSRGESGRQGQGGGKGDSGQGRSAGRKLAEWVSMGVSTLLVLGVAGYLAYQVFQPDPDYVPVAVVPRFDAVRQQDGRYLLPVEVHNRGRRTLRDFKAQITYHLPDGTRGTQELMTSYLGEGEVEKHFLYFEHPPGELGLKAEPLHYSLD